MSDTITLTAPDGRTWDVPNDRLRGFHTVTVTDDSWHIIHPLECDLHDCAFDREAQGWNEMPTMYDGEFRMVEYDGEFRMVEYDDGTVCDPEGEDR